MKHITVYFSLTILCISGCTRQELSEIDQTSIINEIKAILEEYRSGQEGINPGYEHFVNLRADQEGYLAVYDGVRKFQSFEEKIEGAHETAKSFKTNIYLDFENISVLPLAHNVASFTLDFKLADVLHSGDTITSASTWMGVFKKYDGEWKIINEFAVTKDAPLVISEEERKELEEEVKNMLDKLQDINGKKADHFFKFFGKTEGFIVAANGNLPDASFDEVMENVKKSQATYLNLDFHDPKIYVIDRNAATMTSLWDMDFVSAEGDTLTYGGCWTYNMQKINEQWRIIQSIGTESEPRAVGKKE